ncbi:MAG TPA: HAD-IA family hydrolase [Polyangia bacterium]|nr:HAD-IA family hydrolase [Polyangia bacterium]
MYDLLIFDLDGTLIDSAGDIADALNHALAAHGLPTHSDAAIIPMIGKGVTHLVTQAVGPAHLEHLEAVTATFRHYYREHPVGRTRLYPGVAETLAGLGPASKAIATNKPGYLARSIVELLGLAGHFFAVLGDEDMVRRKPDPQVVHDLRARVGAAPERTLFIGDSPIDAATAHAAGVDLCLVSYGYADRAELDALPARYRVDDFRALARLVP